MLKLSELNLDPTSNLYDLTQFKYLFHKLSGFPVQIIFDYHAVCTGSSVLRCLAKHLTPDSELTAIPTPDLDVYVTTETDLTGLLNEVTRLQLNGQQPSVAIKYPSICVSWLLGSSRFTLDINTIEWAEIKIALNHISYSCTRIIYDGTELYLDEIAFQSILNRTFFITNNGFEPVSNPISVLSKYYQRGFDIGDNSSLIVPSYFSPSRISDYSYGDTWMPQLPINKLKLSDYLKAER